MKARDFLPGQIGLFRGGLDEDPDELVICIDTGQEKALVSLSDPENTWTFFKNNKYSAFADHTVVPYLNGARTLLYTTH